MNENLELRCRKCLRRDGEPTPDFEAADEIAKGFTSLGISEGSAVQGTHLIALARAYLALRHSAPPTGIERHVTIEQIADDPALWKGFYEGKIAALQAENKDLDLGWKAAAAACDERDAAIVERNALAARLREKE